MATAPRLASLVHVALTVRDIEASTRWYETVMGFEQVVTVPHAGGHGIVLATPDRTVWWALHHHEGNDGRPFDVTRTGLDHVGLLVPDRTELDRWSRWLADHAVRHDPPRDLPDFGMAALVLYDLDGIALELLGHL